MVSRRLIYSCLMLIPLLLSFTLLSWFKAQCSEQLMISGKVQRAITPLKMFNFGLHAQVLMVVACGFGIVMRPAKPVLAFGLSVWITILSIVLSISAVSAAKSFPALLASVTSFDQDPTSLVELNSLFDAVDTLQGAHGCCGLHDHKDYTSQELRLYLTKNNLMEEAADVPMSCCKEQVQRCNHNVFNGIQALVNKDSGCYAAIVKSVHRCKSNLLSWTILLLIMQAIYLNVLTWGHLRFQQNLSFWVFGRAPRDGSSVLEMSGPYLPILRNETAIALGLRNGGGDWLQQLIPRNVHQD